MSERDDRETKHLYGIVFAYQEQAVRLSTAVGDRMTENSGGG